MGHKRASIQRGARSPKLAGVITVRPQIHELVKLKAAAILLNAANKSIAAAEKTRESSKAEIAQWLKENRQLELDTLPIGEFVNIEGVCLIERGKMNKFDEKAFIFAHAELHSQFKKDVAVTRFKPTVSDK